MLASDRSKIEIKLHYGTEYGGVTMMQPSYGFYIVENSDTVVVYSVTLGERALIIIKNPCEVSTFSPMDIRICFGAGVEKTVIWNTDCPELQSTQ